MEYVIYKRCVPGDRRKVEARSQDAGTGGGARDVRFNPLKTFEGVIPKIFEETDFSSSGRQFNFAPVYWWEDDERQGPLTVRVWSPTEARGGEFRLSRVHKVIPFDEHHIPAPELDPFFFLWNDEERVWARYVTVDELRKPGWPSELADPILGSVEAKPLDQNIRGWRNLRTGEGEHRDVR
ncbi:MAG TPA: hypothetical protein VF504_02245 [Solirubrobacterales bacterium]